MRSQAFVALTLLNVRAQTSWPIQVICSIAIGMAINIATNDKFFVHCFDIHNHPQLFFHTKHHSGAHKIKPILIRD